MNNSEFPKDTNSLLTQDEKLFLDGIPDKGVHFIITHNNPEMRISYVAKDLSTTQYHEFIGERADAVRDYFAMLIAFGIRKDPRDGL